MECREFYSLVVTTSLTAILHFGPVLGPLFAPFKFQAAANTEFRREAILSFCGARHA